ncbi:MAG: A/G-specific adenine glycosylase [Flavobacteriaceae bacterium]|nr:A/G-specific adenine glycosylase [Bacteroidia bacterium]NNK88653.1 A/G-specific adenine glycosylase [Flavobacteriaceae bacterium]
MKKEIYKKLKHWYSVNKRMLPWRETKEPYYIWLSEVILQQTQVKQGLPFYLSFIDSFPTVFDLANAEEDEVLKLWQGLGYYSRARNLHKTAKIVSENHGGRFPQSYDELIRLPGIGDYTASAIASICFEQPCAVVDGNVYRFLSRYFGIDTPIDTQQAKSQFKTLAMELLPQSDFGDHNQGVMEFGARQCKPKSPDCNACIFQASCTAYRLNRVSELPVKRSKQKIKKRYFNYLMVRSNATDKVLLKKRNMRDIWENLYEFPLIEIENSYGINEQTLNDELSKLLSGKDFEAVLFNEKDIVHKLSHQHIYTRFWIVNTESALDEGIPADSINSYAVPALIRDFLEQYGIKQTS